MNKLLIVLLLAIGLAGCGEKAQTVKASPKKSDAQVWQGAQNEFVAPGWKAGDEASWETQMHTRAQSQNEYNRAPAQR